MLFDSLELSLKPKEEK